ncbi:zinc finger protein [Macleaya cordata]|uniref:Zinc finger protein n=1 Tax=Macleaya cordata TaxID=56857 RepID=A0A200Q5Q7_MACCD|nr:zinc finger protein [Macleaya cordata]
MNDESSSSSSNDFNPCPICLGHFKQEAFLDRCFHKFCYSCILNWAKYVSTQSSQQNSTLKCPLCKRHNLSIVYGYDGDSFQQHYINQDSPKSNFFSKVHKFRLQSYYREPGAIYEKFNVLQYWKYRRYLLPNKWLQTWLRREVQALTQEEDVDIIVHHILGVIESFVRLSEREHPKSTTEQKREEFKALIADAARPFLIGRTEHFVNEVELFLSSGLNIEAYDEVYLESLCSVTSGVKSEVAEEGSHEQTLNVPYLHFFYEDSDTD